MFHMFFFLEWCEGNKKIQFSSIRLYLYSVFYDQYCLQAI